jgi:RNA polymerase sigma factor (sigma-70 family)
MVVPDRLYPGVEAMRVAGRASETEGRVAGLLALHGAALRRVARRWSLCEEDAEDALQRSLEIYVRRLATVERATEAAWLKVVIRNEALAIRRTRGESVGREDVDLDARTAADVRALEDKVADRERSARSAEALRDLKPDEALALLLKAEGHSYQEIAASQGWTYTKVNRAITEGRARFMKSFRAIEEGEACDRLAPVLAALAAGSATAAQLREARPHLRHCAACRAALRALHAPLRRRVAALLPLGPVVTPVEWAHRHLVGGPPADPTEDLHGLHLPDVEDTVDRLPEHAERVPRPRPFFHDLLHRITGSDLVTSIQVTTSSGGGRGAAVAALLGVCLSGVGAGTYCAATALLPDPPVIKTEQHATKKRAAASHHGHAPRTASAPSSKPRARLVDTPPPTPPRTTRTASTHPTPPGSSASSKSASRREFSFESSMGSPGTSSSSTPAATTASSGGSHSSGGGGSGGRGGGSSATSGGEFLP